MKYEGPPTLHSVIGGMTTDYFDFFCMECEAHIDRLTFYCEDSVGVQLQADCPKCGETSIFKIKVREPLTKR